jgi:excisionase family DNA binding protein
MSIRHNLNQTSRVELAPTNPPQNGVGSAISNERLLRFLHATPEQLAVIDRVLAGKNHESEEHRRGPLLLGMGAAAKLLGVSRATLWRMLKCGRLDRVEVLPGSFRIRRTDVEAIALSGTVAKAGLR